MNEQNDAIRNPIAGLKYDGPMMGGWFQFTEMDETSPSLRASFYTRSTDRDEVLEKRASKRAVFAGATTQ